MVYMVRIIQCATLSFLVSCAGQYQLSESAKSFQASLDRQTALATVKSHIVQDSTQKGVCAAITYVTAIPDPAKFIRLEDTQLIFQGKQQKFTGMSTKELGAYKQIRSTYKLEDGQYNIDLTQLKIIEADVGEPQFVYSCHDHKDGYTVKLFSQDGISLIIQVDAVREEQLIAALSYLSPNAKLQSRR